MKKLSQLGLIFSIMLLASVEAKSQQKDKIRVIAVFAHPDDADSKMGGTASLLAQMGVAVKFVALT